MDKWKRIEEKLRYVFGNVKVRADGHEVTFDKRVDTKKQKLVIETYVDGWIKGEWMNVQNGQPLHPEGRFFRPRKSAVWKRKDFKMLKKIYGTKKAEEMVTPKVIVLDPYWGSPRTLVAHLKREFPDLEIVEDSSHG